MNESQIQNTTGYQRDTSVSMPNELSSGLKPYSLDKSLYGQNNHLAPQLNQEPVGYFSLKDNEVLSPSEETLAIEFENHLNNTAAILTHENEQRFLNAQRLRQQKSDEEKYPDYYKSTLLNPENKPGNYFQRAMVSLTRTFRARFTKSLISITTGAVAFVVAGKMPSPTAPYIIDLPVSQSDSAGTDSDSIDSNSIQYSTNGVVDPKTIEDPALIVNENEIITPSATPSIGNSETTPVATPQSTPIVEPQEDSSRTEVSTEDETQPTERKLDSATENLPTRENVKIYLLGDSIIGGMMPEELEDYFNHELDINATYVGTQVHSGYNHVNFDSHNGISAGEALYQLSMQDKNNLWDGLPLVDFTQADNIPDILVLQFGSNHLSRDYNDLSTQSIEALIGYMNQNVSKEMTIIVSGVPHSLKEWDKSVDRFNSALQDMVSRLQSTGIKVVFSPSDNINTQEDIILSDGVHLTTTGSEKLARNIGDVVNGILLENERTIAESGGFVESTKEELAPYLLEYSKYTELSEPLTVLSGDLAPEASIPYFYKWINRFKVYENPLMDQFDEHFKELGLLNEDEGLVYNLAIGILKEEWGYAGHSDGIGQVLPETRDIVLNEMSRKDLEELARIVDIKTVYNNGNPISSIDIAKALSLKYSSSAELQVAVSVATIKHYTNEFGPLLGVLAYNRPSSAQAFLAQYGNSIEVANKVIMDLYLINSGKEPSFYQYSNLIYGEDGARMLSDGTSRATVSISFNVDVGNGFTRNQIIGFSYLFSPNFDKKTFLEYLQSKVNQFNLNGDELKAQDYQSLYYYIHQITDDEYKDWYEQAKRDSSDYLIAFDNKVGVLDHVDSFQSVP